MNSLAKNSKLVLPVLFFLVLIAFGYVNASAQSIPMRKPVTDISDSLNASYDELAIKFGENKELPKGYEKQIIYVLSYFPELVHSKIRFKIKKSKDGIISTRATFGSVFKKSSKRTYLVIMSDSIAGRTLPSFTNGNVNGQVGILGHELCHIVYFNTRTGLGLMGFGIAHISSSYMDRFEYNTDSMTIERALGYQLIAWKEYLYKGFQASRPNDSLPSEKPKAHKRYMSIEEVRQAIAKNILYK